MRLLLDLLGVIASLTGIAGVIVRRQLGKRESHREFVTRIKRENKQLDDITKELD